MPQFNIGIQRLLHIIHYELQKSPTVDLDWNLSSDGVLDVYISSRYTSYHYQQTNTFNEADIHPELYFQLTPQRRITSVEKEKETVREYFIPPPITLIDEEEPSAE